MIRLILAKIIFKLFFTMLLVLITVFVIYQISTPSRALARQQAQEQIIATLWPLSEHELQQTNFVTQKFRMPSLYQSNAEQNLTVACINNQVRYIVLNISTAHAYNAPLKLAVVIDAQGNLARVRVLHHEETPGLGDQFNLYQGRWLDSLINTDPNHKYRLRQDGGSIDSFTGATITPRAIVMTLADIYQHRQQLLTLTKAICKPEHQNY